MFAASLVKLRPLMAAPRLPAAAAFSRVQNRGAMVFQREFARKAAAKKKEVSQTQASASQQGNLVQNGSNDNGNLHPTLAYPGVKHQVLASPHTVSVIGAPLYLGQPLLGVEQGPDSIRDRGLMRRVTQLGWMAYDRGNLDFTGARFSAEQDSPLARHSQAVGYANKLLHDATYEEAKKGRFVLSLGGDHSIAIGSVSGLLKARPDLSIVWVDAHADLNTPESSLSKNIHGMSVAFLMNGDHCKPSKVRGFEWMDGLTPLQKDRLVYIGLRDLDRAEKDYIRNMNILTFTMQHIDKFGIGKVLDLALEHLNKVVPGGPLHLSVDIDSVDPFLAPSTGTKVHGGLSYREANYLCEALYETGRLTSMDLVEVNPLLETKDVSTGEMAVEMISSALGARIL